MHSGARLTVLSFLAVMTWTTAAWAETITYRFDDLSPGSYTWNHYAPVLYFWSVGVPEESNSGGFRVVAASNAVSAPNVALPSTPQFGHVYNTFQGYFGAPNSPNFLPIDFLSFRVVGTRAGQTQPWTAQIWSVNGNNLSVAETRQGTTDALVSFTRSSPDILLFRFIESPNMEAMDDLSINAPVTPEPASLLLVGTGMLGCAARLRKRRSK